MHLFFRAGICFIHKTIKFFPADLILISLSKHYGICYFAGDLGRNEVFCVSIGHDLFDEVGLRFYAEYEVGKGEFLSKFVRLGHLLD